jgi:hypothetical protein
MQEKFNSIKSRICLFIFIVSLISGCTPKRQADSDVTFQSDEDEIILYISFSKKAADELGREFDGTVDFESLCNFLIRSSVDQVPFWEGSMTAAAILKKQVEIEEATQRPSQAGIKIEIIGFKQNPVQIMKGALDFPDAPRYLNDFSPTEYEDFVSSMLDIMKGDAFVVHINVR